IADFEFVFEGLEVNIARPVLDRLVEDQIDKPNDRGCICLGFNRGLAISLSQLEKLPNFAELLENFLHARRVGAIMLLDQIFDLIWRRNDHVNVFAKRKAEILWRAMIERI